MVRLYFKGRDITGKRLFVDVSIWSFLKVNILSSLLFALLFYGTLFLVGFILSLI